MDILLLTKAFILGIVEGLTEFLPVSSTGHLILAGDLLNFNDDKGKVFEIVIQAGAILAICWEYRARLLSTFAGIGRDPVAQKFATNLFIAFLPLAVFGLAFNKAIKAALFKPVPVALAFIIGGVIILFAERWYKARAIRQTAPPIDSVDQLVWKDALKLGIAQCAALIPGTSRSGATIIGGLFFGLSRKCATEFSFFLAIPTLFAATGYSLWKERALLSVADVPMFGVGSVAAFISAFVVVRWLIRYVSTHDFTIFAWYRIAFGLVVLVTAYSGAVAWSPG
ncbi:MAG TPA: undecaprenyl-diphosphate phosphatase [Usitatibacteraceae bacterium]